MRHVSVIAHQTVIGLWGVIGSTQHEEGYCADHDLTMFVSANSVVQNSTHLRKTWVMWHLPCVTPRWLKAQVSN